MRLPILTARHWTIGRLTIAPGWLMVSWASSRFGVWADWSLACLRCGHLTTGCRDHWFCGLCETCRAHEEAA